jgi:peroxiredoxin
MPTGLRRPDARPPGAMSKTIVSLIILVLGIVASSQVCRGTSLEVGKPAPPFVLESGDNHKLTLGMTRGKVVVLFYESRQVIKKNKQLKDELKRLYRIQPANIKRDIIRLVVIDCSEASLLTAPIWKYKLVENSEKEGFKIYGDWNRRMFADYHMKGDESNFLIIDKNGIIRYAATGKIAPSQFDRIEKLLLTLVREK